MRQIPHWTLTVLAIVSLLMAMLGCQGVSSARSDSDPPPPAAQLTASSTSLSFGTVAVGTIQVLPETVTNNGTASLTLTTVSVTGTGFTISGLTLPMALAAGQSTSFNVVFQPPSVVTGGTGNVALANTGTNSVLNIPLSGSGATPAAVTASPMGYSFGTVAMGSMVTESETLTNADVNSVTISQATVIGAGFGVINLNLPLTLAPGQTTTFGVTFSPAALPGTDGAVVLAINGVSNALVLGYSGAGGSTAVPAVVSPSPSSLTFSNITTGQTSSQTITLTNTGGVSTTVSQATASGTGFSVSGFTAGTLLPGATTSFSVTFAPTTAGTFPGTVTVTSNASNPSLSIPLSGTAVTPPAVLTASPTSLTYTNITVGQTSNQTETIKNTGGTNATISAVAESGTGFSVSGITTPVTLTPGQSTTFTVTFSPTSITTFSGTVTVTSNASNPSVAIPLSGTAEGAPAVLTATPTTLTYTNITVGQTSSQTETIKNTGGTSATISAVAA
ncbi:MAG: choice-of-anchor D domain-containing protein, partial [Candidatus Sulfotelmatobacter sp.]